MESDPKEKYQKQAQRYLRESVNSYVLDAISGIYKHKSVEASENSHSEQAGTNRQNRFFTDPRTDWRPVLLSAGISILTLVLLVLTAWYASKEVQQMKLSSDQVERGVILNIGQLYAANRALKENQIQSTTAAEALKTSKIISNLVYGDGAIGLSKWMGFYRDEKNTFDAHISVEVIGGKYPPGNVQIASRIEVRNEPPSPEEYKPSKLPKFSDIEPIRSSYDDKKKSFANDGTPSNEVEPHSIFNNPKKSFQGTGTNVYVWGLIRNQSATGGKWNPPAEFCRFMPISEVLKARPGMNYGTGNGTDCLQ